MVSITTSPTAYNLDTIQEVLDWNPKWIDTDRAILRTIITRMRYVHGNLHFHVPPSEVYIRVTAGKNRVLCYIHKGFIRIPDYVNPEWNKTVWQWPFSTAQSRRF